MDKSFFLYNFFCNKTNVTAQGIHTYIYYIIVFFFPGTNSGLAHPIEGNVATACNLIFLIIQSITVVFTILCVHIEVPEEGGREGEGVIFRLISAQKTRRSGTK